MMISGSLCAAGAKPPGALLFWRAKDTGAGGDVLVLDPLSMPIPRPEQSVPREPARWKHQTAGEVALA
jgi:hypothetical protein